MAEEQFVGLYFYAFLGLVTASSWTKIPQPVCPDEGSAVTLECAFDGLTASPTPVWRRFVNESSERVSDGRNIISSDCQFCEITGDESAGEYHLTINRVTESHVGVWVCSLFGASPGSENALLSIPEPCTGVNLTSEPNLSQDDLVLMEGTQLNLSCSPLGCANTCAKITWQNGTRTIVTDKSDISIILQKYDNLGTIKCVATNNVTDAYPEEVVRPKVHHKPSNGRIVSECEGGDVKLTCHFDAYPSINVNYTWEYDGKAEKNGQTIELHSLPADVKCLARNEYGESEPTMAYVRKCGGLKVWEIVLIIIAIWIAIFMLQAGVSLIYCKCKNIGLTKKDKRNILLLSILPIIAIPFLWRYISRKKKEQEKVESKHTGADSNVDNSEPLKNVGQ